MTNIWNNDIIFNMVNGITITMIDFNDVIL